MILRETVQERGIESDQGSILEYNSDYDAGENEVSSK